MVRRYLDINVYDALMQRFDFIFREFDNIYVSFSGGKDCGMLLNAVIDFRDSRYPGRTVGLYHQDFEAQYTVTTEYIERTFERLKDRTEPYWVCLPMATRTAMSSYAMFWYPWDDTKKDIWVRPMRSIPMWSILTRRLSITATKCIRRILQSSSEGTTWRSTAAGRPYAC